MTIPFVVFALCVCGAFCLGVWIAANVRRDRGSSDIEVIDVTKEDRR